MLAVKRERGTATTMSVIKDVQWFVRSFKQTDRSGYTVLHADEEWNRNNGIDVYGRQYRRCRAV